MKTNTILGIGLIVLATFRLQAQVVGGRGNSDMTPKVAEPSKLNNGAFKGDVNLFTGDYQTSYPLGSVSTPGGLNFTLTYSNSSAFTVGGNTQVCSGIPYGDGWSLNIPTISVETDVFSNFSVCQLDDENSLEGNNLLQYGNNASKEGDVYWFSPEINIPGVASGRAVFKYVDEADDRCPVFVLNEFEAPIEIRFKANGWEVLLPDGTKYRFQTSILSNRAPSNARTLFYDQNDPGSANNAARNQYLSGDLSPNVVNAIMPKESYNVWYCDQIFNLNYPQQSILFNYEKFGAFNYFQEFNQPALKQALIDVADISTFVYDANYTVYSDILLQKISSFGPQAPMDELRLTYRTDSDALTHPELINFHTDSGAERVDSLYTSIPVYSITGTDQFSNWKRYNHVKKLSAGQSMPNSGNPYEFADGYHRDLGLSGTDLPFDHGFLESERIPASDLIAGDIYEIRAKVKRPSGNDLTMGNGTIDVNIVSGTLQTNATNPNPAIYLDQGTIIPRDEYNDTRGVELFSTFNMAIKWMMAHGENNKQTSNFFVMPNIPSSFQGINIQIGAGNSDTDFDYQDGINQQHPGDLQRIVGGIVEYNSALTYTFETNLNSRLLRSAASIPHNFGVGLPWSNVLPLAHRMADPTVYSNYGMNTFFPYFNFWTAQQANDPNIPTKFDANTKLDEVELIRYTKNPLMLVKVELYHLNGELSSQDDSGWKLMNQKELGYKTTASQMVENFDYQIYDVDFDPEVDPDPNPKPLHFNSKFQLHILLTSIKEVPLDYDYNLDDTTQLQTTFLSYKPFLKDANTYYQKFPNTGYPGMVLNKIVDPLGGITKIEYYPAAHDLTYRNNRYNYPTSCDAITTRPYGLPHVVIVHPVVHFVVKNDEDDNDLGNGLSGNQSMRTEYVFDLSSRTGIDKDLKLDVDNGHFRNRSELSSFKGFGKVRVFSAELSSEERNYTDYEHFTNPTGGTQTALEKYLYFGKLKSIRSYDHTEAIHEEKLFAYENTLAFQNGYLRPNPYRKGIAYEEKDYDRLIHQYEYQDYYRNQELVIDNLGTSITGTDAYSYLDIPAFTGTGHLFERPKSLEFEYYASLMTTNPDFYLNSYFVRMSSEITRTYETMLSKETIGFINPNGVGTTKNNNPNGNGKNNPVGTNGSNDATQLSSIQSNGNNPNAASIATSLINASPLSETVLLAVMNSTKFNASQKTNILLAQNGLSNTLWDAVLAAEKKFTPQQLLSLIDKQAYFTDYTLMKLIDVNHSNLDSKVFEAMLLKAPFLSNQVMLHLIQTTGYMNHKSFTEIFTKQPTLTEELLILIVQSPYVVVNSLPELLQDQNVTDAVYQALANRSDINDNVLATIVEHDPMYPSETALLNLLDRVPLLQHNELKRIIAAANREIEPSVEAKIMAKVPNQSKQNEILGLIVRVNPLNKYCTNPVTSERTFIETKTTYEYYEADFRGSTNGRAYKTLMSLQDIPNRVIQLQPFFGSGGVRTIDKVYLKHEPSWQLFSKKTTSVHLPGANTEEQYFYLYDLKNRYDRYWFNYDIEGANPKAAVLDLDYSETLRDTIGYAFGWDTDYKGDQDGIYVLPKFDGMVFSQEKNLRNLPFQTTVFSKNVTDQSPVMRSEYYHYDARWKFEEEDLLLQDTYPGAPCNTPDPEDPVVGCATCMEIKVPHSGTQYLELKSSLPYNFCLWELPTIGYSMCPSSYTVNPCDPNATLLSCNPTLVDDDIQQSIPQASALKNTLQLKSTFTQVDDVTLPEDQANAADNSEFYNGKIDHANWYIMEFFMGNLQSVDGDNFKVNYRPILPFSNLLTAKILKRNFFMQPEIVQNQVGIMTRYYYTKPTFTHYQNENCPSSGYTAIHYEDIAQPVRVTAGYGRADSMAVAYQYTDQGMVSKVTQPSGHYLEYQFDGFLRLTQVKENGTRLLAKTGYTQWKHDFGLSFQDRTRQNFVSTISYNDYVINGTMDTNQRVHQKAFVDPLGREHSVSQHYDQEYLYSGTIGYDNWGRTVRSHKSTAMFSQNEIPLDVSDENGNEFMENQYENTPKSRVVRASNYGVTIGDIHTVKTEYAFANHVFTSCELELSRDELALLMQNGNTTNFRFVRTRTLDQDNKELIEYSNAFGQKVATLAYDGNIKIVTLFGYDSYGNLTKVINPEKQESSYEYNLIGKLIREKTVDAGEKRYLYNKHLQVSAIQDELHRTHRNALDQPEPMYRSFQYDDYGRLIAQGTGVLFPIINTQNQQIAGYYDFFAYQNTTISGGTGHNQYLFDYVFSNISSLDWLTSYRTLDNAVPVQHEDIVQPAPSLTQYEKRFTYGTDGTTAPVGKLLATTSYSNTGLPIQEVNYTYNAEDQVSAQTVHFHPTDLNTNGGSEHVYATIQYPKYNFKGSLLQETVDVGSNGTVDMHYHYEYDDLNRLVKVYASQDYVPNKADATQIASYSYDNATGLMVYESHNFHFNNIIATAQQIDYSYDIRDRLTALNSELLAYNLFYDNQEPPTQDGEHVQASFNFNGNINGIQASYLFATTINNPTNFEFPTVYGYQYDKLNRLVKADALVGDFIHDAVGANQLQESYLIGDEQFSYDRIGNIKTLERHKKADDPLLMSQQEAFSYAYITGKNRLVTAIGAPGTPNRGFSYDANGNVLTDNFKGISQTNYGRGAYAFDLVKNNEAIHYVYDVNDLRIFKESNVNGQSKKEYTLKDAMNHDIAMYDYSMNSWTYNVYGQNLVARIDQNLDNDKQIILHEATYYLYDHLGNTRVTYKAENTSIKNTLFIEGVGLIYITETEHRVIYAGDYFPYGKVLREFADGQIERYLSTNHDRDQETGLDYRGARYYDSDLGRFLSIDPWQSKYPMFSTYNYVAANPTALVDESGKGPIHPRTGREVYAGIYAIGWWELLDFSYTKMKNPRYWDYGLIQSARYNQEAYSDPYGGDDFPKIEPRNFIGSYKTKIKDHGRYMQTDNLLKSARLGAHKLRNSGNFSGLEYAAKSGNYVYGVESFSTYTITTVVDNWIREEAIFKQGEDTKWRINSKISYEIFEGGIINKATYETDDYGKKMFAGYEEYQVYNIKEKTEKYDDSGNIISTKTYNFSLEFKVHQ